MDETKQRLLEAAGQEFAEKGYDGATVRTICARAGVNLAAVNYHFGDKEQLYTSAVFAAHRCGAADLSVEAMQTGEPAEQLRRFIGHFLRNTLDIDRSGSWQQILMMREMHRPTSASHCLVDQVIRPKFEALSGIIKRIRPDLEGRRLVATVFSVIGQCLYYRIGRPVAERLIGPDVYASLDADFLTDHITNFVLSALEANETHVGAGAVGSEEA